MTRFPNSCGPLPSAGPVRVFGGPPSPRGRGVEQTRRSQPALGAQWRVNAEPGVALSSPDSVSAATLSGPERFALPKMRGSASPRGQRILGSPVPTVTPNLS